MSLTPRIIVPGLAHHVTQRGNNRQIIFEEADDYLKYCSWMNKYASKNGLEILAYCLMANHVHFIVIPEHEESLSKTFHAADMRYAQFINKKRGSSGHVWQGRFYSCPMNEHHLYRAIRYVEQNPVRGGLVKKAWRYPWSSARWHVGITRIPDIFLQNAELVDKNHWKEYLCEEDEALELLTAPGAQASGAVNNFRFESP
ncbi:MAG: transposase [Candidatus Omnitrophica bacterium]|nr:transposase [Candidatus Omnitrophota bacterium]